MIKCHTSVIVNIKIMSDENIGTIKEILENYGNLRIEYEPISNINIFCLKVYSVTVAELSNIVTDVYNIDQCARINIYGYADNSF